MQKLTLAEAIDQDETISFQGGGLIHGVLDTLGGVLGVGRLGGTIDQDITIKFNGRRPHKRF